MDNNGLCFKKFYASLLISSALAISILIILLSIDDNIIENQHLIEALIYGMYGTALTLSGVKAFENVRIFKTHVERTKELNDK